MGGVGGKGKGARRRQKLLDNAKTFDKKSGTFREPKLELVNDKVSREDILRAPSSFRRFMEATRRAKAREERRDKQRRIAQGLEAPGDGGDGVDAATRRRRAEMTPARPREGRGGADDALPRRATGVRAGRTGRRRAVVRAGASGVRRGRFRGRGARGVPSGAPLGFVDARRSRGGRRDRG